MDVVQVNKVDAARVSRRALSHGLAVRKGDVRHLGPRNHGGLQVVDPRTGTPLAGEIYDLDAAQADAAITAILRQGSVNGIDALRRQVEGLAAEVQKLKGAQA